MSGPAKAQEMTLLDVDDDMLLRILVFFLNVPTRETIDNGDFDPKEPMGAPIVWKLVCRKMNELLPGRVRTHLDKMCHTVQLLDFARNFGGAVHITEQHPLSPGEEIPDTLDQCLLRVCARANEQLFNDTLWFQFFAPYKAGSEWWVMKTHLFSAHGPDGQSKNPGHNNHLADQAIKNGGSVWPVDLLLQMGQGLSCEAIFNWVQWNGGVTVTERPPTVEELDDEDGRWEDVLGMDGFCDVAFEEDSLVARLITAKIMHGKTKYMHKVEEYEEPNVIEIDIEDYGQLPNYLDLVDALQKGCKVFESFDREAWLIERYGQVLEVDCRMSDNMQQAKQWVATFPLCEHCGGTLESYYGKRRCCRT